MLPVFLWILTSGENYFSVSISFQTPAANAPPANGPRITNQCLRVLLLPASDYFKHRSVIIKLRRETVLLL